MHLQSARDLKTELLARVGRQPRLADHLLRHARLTPTAHRQFRREIPIALGIGGRKGEHTLAIRVHHPHPEVEKLVAKIHATARGEIHLKFVGRIHAQFARKRPRRGRDPLRIGDSIGLASMSMGAGTLGCFVRPAGRDEGVRFILSNNHVLADENRAKPGAAILHPGPADGGGGGGSRVGRLVRFTKLARHGNRMDAALAEVDDAIAVDAGTLAGFGDLAGVRATPVHEKDPVYKIGRASGFTRGRVSAFEIEGVQVSFPYPGVAIGSDQALTITFDHQIEIEPAAGSEPFSRGGDSGSLVVDRSRRAVGLLFSGNDINVTYVSPIGTILDALAVKLAI